MLEQFLSWSKILQIVWGKMQYTKAYILWRLNIEDNKWVAKLFLLWTISFSSLLCRVDGGDAAFLFSLYHKVAGRSRGNEWNRGVATMKSSLRSDEIFSLRLQMKLNPPISPAARQISSRSDFIHRRWISSAIGGFNWKKPIAFAIGFFLVIPLQNRSI